MHSLARFMAIISCVNLTLMHTPHASHEAKPRQGHLIHGSYEEKNHAQLSSVSFLSRKLLKLDEESMDVKGFGEKDHAHLMDDSAGEKMLVKEEEVSLREWIEGSKKLPEYSTMDYEAVRRRLPIHNKDIPSVP